MRGRYYVKAKIYTLHGARTNHHSNVEEGHTNREIADHLGLEKRQIECWVNRRNRKQRKAEAGILPKTKGRPKVRPLSTIEEYQHEIATLKMENKLLRDFLQLTERM